jgi:prepilin signal peptidase PulO-like enzyme (type II secretory pathway)
MLNLATALWLASVGASVGSFVNVVAYRLPLGASIVWIPSRCPKCGFPIRLCDNIPIFGWLILGGRCRDCGVRISARYFIVEVAMAAAFLILAYAELFSGGANLPNGRLTSFTGAWGTIWHPEWELIGVYFYHCVLLSVLMAVALIDLDGQRAPWTLIGVGIAVSLASKHFLPATNASSGMQLVEDLGDRSVVAAAIGVAIGALCGPLLSLPYGALRIHYFEDDRIDRFVLLRHWRTGCVLSICGALTGVSSLSWLILVSLWFCSWLVQFCLVGPSMRRVRTSLILGLWPATLILILCWRPLFEWLEPMIVR